jgi:hypothetical protein
LHTLNVDEAVAEFLAALREVLGPDTGGGLRAIVRETLEEAEARRFRCAAQLLGWVCPDAMRCINQRCRRTRLCRHFAELRERQQLSIDQSTRRTPGADALRQAIWLFMNSNAMRVGTG